MSRKKSADRTESASIWEKVKREVRKLGGEVVGGRIGRWYRFNLEAPGGHVWNATGDTESLAVEWMKGDHKWKLGAALDALERVGLGVSLGDTDDEGEDGPAVAMFEVYDVPTAKPSEYAVIDIPITDTENQS